MKSLLYVFPLVALLVAGCGGDESEGNFFDEPATNVEVTLKDFRIEPATILLDRPGVYTFVAKNEGTVNHIFEVESDDLESETSEVAPGDTGELTIRLKANTYKIYCPLDDHEKQGMRGTMVVEATTTGVG